jgi:predicted DNA-binding transcriptional regulator AlpA
MTDELGVLIRRLASDPSPLHGLTPEQERSLAASLRDIVGAKQSRQTAAASLAPSAAWSEDDLLTVDGAAAVLKVSPRWLYRHAPTLPFARKLSRKVLRFSRSGISRWLATRRYHPSVAAR